MKFSKNRNKPRPRPSAAPTKKTTADYMAEKKAKAALLEDWIWGEHSVEALVESQPEQLLEIFVENESAKRLTRFMNKISGLKISLVEKLPRFLSEKRTQGIAAKIKSFPVFHENVFFDSETSDKTQVLVLDRIQDPQNFGAILRSAAALGASAIFIGRREQCPVNGTVALVSAGNLFRVKIYTANNLAHSCERLKEKGFHVLALDSKGLPLDGYMAKERPEKVAWILGAEEDGIHSSLSKMATEKIGIPMLPGVESLNVSNSAAIALYEGYKFLS